MAYVFTAEELSYALRAMWETTCEGFNGEYCSCASTWHKDRSYEAIQARHEEHIAIDEAEIIAQIVKARSE
jgi:hypothetical protein